MVPSRRHPWERQTPISGQSRQSGDWGGGGARRVGWWFRYARLRRATQPPGGGATVLPVIECRRAAPVHRGHGVRVSRETSRHSRGVWFRYARLRRATRPPTCVPVIECRRVAPVYRDHIPQPVMVSIRRLRRLLNHRKAAAPGYSTSASGADHAGGLGDHAFADYLDPHIGELVLANDLLGRGDLVRCVGALQ